MKVYLLDTNIIINAGKSLDFQSNLHQRFRLFDPDIKRIVSIVTTGELLVHSPKQLLGSKRRNRQQAIMNTIAVAKITEPIVGFYADIDLFSRGKHPTRPLAGSARIMGKNDIWIAATAAYFNAELITTDRDFEHLNGEFLTVHYIEQEW